MRTIAIANQKGGSAKTTTAVNLASALARKRKRVLLVDLDPQASASAWLSTTGDRGLLDVLVEAKPLEGFVVPSSVEGVDVVPSSAWLIGTEKALAGQVGAELALRDAIKRLPAKWDLLLIDCPPSLGLLSISALTACAELLVPVETRTMALAGLAALIQTVERVTERLNERLRITGILACRYDSRTRLSEEIVSSLRARFGQQVFRTVVRENVRLAEAPSFAKPIDHYDPRCPGTEDYAAVAAEVLAREGGGRDKRSKRIRLR